MNTINVKIDISTPKGLKLLRDLHGQKCVEIEDLPQPEDTKKLHTLDEAYKMMMNWVDDHYGKE